MCDALRELMKPELDEAVDKKVEEMAIKMIRANEPDFKIIEYTDLTAEKIQELRKNESVSA